MVSEISIGQGHEVHSRTNGRNRDLPTVVLAAIATSVREGSPVSVTLDKGHPCPERGAVLCFQVMTVDKRRIEDLIGVVPADKMVEVDRKIALSFGLPLP